MCADFAGFLPRDACLAFFFVLGADVLAPWPRFSFALAASLGEVFLGGLDWVWEGGVVELCGAGAAGVSELCAAGLPGAGGVAAGAAAERGAEGVGVPGEPAATR